MEINNEARIKAMGILVWEPIVLTKRNRSMRSLPNCLLLSEPDQNDTVNNDLMYKHNDYMCPVSNFRSLEYTPGMTWERRIW